MVIISLELGRLEPARRYVQRLEVLRDKVASKPIDLLYNLTRALLLKASPRTRDKMQAQMLFQQLAEDEILSLDITVRACLNLCELLFFEFKTSEDPDILHEIQTVTNRLLGVAKAQQSHSLLAETYLLQAKLAILNLDMPCARHLFTQAQGIADKQGLQLLARNISITYIQSIFQDKLTYVFFGCASACSIMIFCEKTYGVTGKPSEC